MSGAGRIGDGETEAQRRGKDQPECLGGVSERHGEENLQSLHTMCAQQHAGHSVNPQPSLMPTCQGSAHSSHSELRGLRLCDTMFLGLTLTGNQAL